MWMRLKATDQFGRRYRSSGRMKLKGKLLIAVWWWERYSRKNIQKKEMLHSHNQVMSDIKKWQAINKTITFVSAAVKKKWKKKKEFKEEVRETEEENKKKKKRRKMEEKLMK